MSTQEFDAAHLADPRWVENRLDARGLGGFGRRVTVQAAAIMHRHLGMAPQEACGILVYRRLAPALPGLPKPTHNVTPERFQSQLAGLLESGRVFWPLEKILEFNDRGWRVMPWVTALSFEIGFAGIHAYALPILRQLNIPATVFVDANHHTDEAPFPTDTWARRHATELPTHTYRPLNLDECRELAESNLFSLACLPSPQTDTDPHADDRQTNKVFGAFALKTGLAEAVETLDWRRIHVASWDTPATLASRLSTRRPTGRLNGGTNRPPTPDTSATPNPQTACQTTDISIIVPTYNRAHWVGEALRSLINQETNGEFSFDIHVVDNASDDATARVLSDVAAGSPVAIQPHRQETPGDAPTRNLGVTQSTGKWLAFFDDDQVADPSWLRQLWSATCGGERPIVGGAVHLNMSDDELQTLDPLCRAALRETRLYPSTRPYRRRHLPGTGNALVSRTVFDAIGDFDETMTGGGSDCDFFTRARDAGFPLWYTPDAIVLHRVPAERLTAEFLRWDALSGGAEHAGYFDFQRRGLVALLGLCGARLLQALLIHVPLLLWAQLRGDTHAILGRKTSLWRTEGYARRTLSIVAPSWFAQPRFFESLDLRQGRSICG